MKCTKCNQEFLTTQFTQALIHFESHKRVLDYRVEWYLITKELSHGITTIHKLFRSS